MNERDKTLVSAETAAKSKPLNVSVMAVVDRAILNDGHGLRPSEVMALARVLSETAELFREYERGTFASHHFVSKLHGLMFHGGGGRAA